MANVKLTRHDWIDAALALLTDEGIDAVRVEPLARRLGVTKGSFYGYFTGLEVFLVEVIRVWEIDVTEGILAQVAKDGDPRKRMRQLAVALVSHPNRTVHTELAVREWARKAPEVDECVRRVQAIQWDLLMQIFSEFCDEREATYRSVVAMSARLATPMLEGGPDGDPAGRIEFVVQQLIR
ncbi:hypothetical protein BW730_02995 [Tessaracoccus aquimaris]|uniref:HTH tetR-type domain-containing protein n=1 Tax=Tessaracoccus aquimaris TaxID=1332264 RepID=A0A1Q2CKL1_9ACTN|nr:TetR/AcrR family transcriptional regulator [Tessaracoccus aquimaris]AQP46654.1 hypothetical protein BW730_02995 [Tessaracoccus aquimaris]